MSRGIYIYIFLSDKKVQNLALDGKNNNLIKHYVSGSGNDESGDSHHYRFINNNINKTNKKLPRRRKTDWQAGQG